MNRSKIEFIKLAGKGMLMGAADVVPGVSGGTIAFMTGIYEELINSLKSFDTQALKKILARDFSGFMKHVNASFLLTLFLGILVSIVSIAHLVLYLLEFHPILTWSFFFGLILASTLSLLRHLGLVNLQVVMFFILGVLIAFQITSMTPHQVDPELWMFFLAGSIAICAMILPGISGSFILLLLGMYTPVLLALKELQILFVFAFALGCALGLLSFSHVLSWAFSHYRVMTLALLGGFMLGSLNKVWPWKYVVQYELDRDGVKIPIVEKNVLPWTYEALSGNAALLGYAILLCLLGMSLVFLLDKQKSKDNIN